MNKIALITHYNSPELEQLNDSLALLLADTDSVDVPVTEQILKLVEQRQDIINELLKQIDDEPKRSFARDEYENNKSINAAVTTLFEMAKQDAVNFIRSKKLVTKYDK